MPSSKDNGGALDGEEPPTKALPPSTKASPFFGNNVTTLLFAVISLAVYLLLLRPTTGATREERQRRQEREQRQRQGGRRMTRNNNNTNNNNNNINVHAARTANRPGRVADPAAVAAAAAGGGGGGGAIGITSRQPPLSENAIEILSNCRSGPPHLQSEQLQKIKSMSMSTSDGGDTDDKNSTTTTNTTATTTTTSATPQQVARTIGGNQFLVDGVVGWNYTTSSSAVKQTILPERAKQLRQDRAKILSRWLTEAADSHSNSSSGGGNNTDGDDNRTSNSTSNSSNLAVLPPPAPKSTVVIGLSFRMIVDSVDDKSQDSTASSSSSSPSAVVDILYRLSTYYSVLLMVQLPEGNTNSGSIKGYDVLHGQIIKALRTASDGVLTEQILPSHRIMVCQSPTGRVALVRQLRQVGLIIDFDPTVKAELERFGYSVSVVSSPEWTSTASSLTPLSML